VAKWRGWMIPELRRRLDVTSFLRRGGADAKAETNWGDRMIAKVLWTSVGGGQMTKRGPNYSNWFLL
jgi:hypothetical protein